MTACWPHLRRILPRAGFSHTGDEEVILVAPDIGNLHMVDEHRRRGIATWLAGLAAELLQLAHVTG